MNCASDFHPFCLQIPVNVVDAVDWSEMIPHEVYGADFVSWNDSVFSGVVADPVHQ